MSEDQRSGVTFDLDPDHLEAQTFAMWLAFGEALRMLAAARGRDGWHRDLYDRVQDKIAQGQFSTLSGAPMPKAENSAADGAAKAASRIVDAAFSRLI